MVDTGILSNNLKFLSHECKMTFCRLIYTDHPPPIRPNHDLINELDFYRIIRGFHRTFATDVACQYGTLTPLDTWSCPIWDLHKFYFLRPIISLNLSLFCSGLCSLIIPRYMYFLDFASYSNYMMWKIISTCNTANRHLIFIVAEMIFILYVNNEWCAAL